MAKRRETESRPTKSRGWLVERGKGPRTAMIPVPTYLMVSQKGPTGPVLCVYSETDGQIRTFEVEDDQNGSLAENMLQGLLFV